MVIDVACVVTINLAIEICNSVLQNEWKGTSSLDNIQKVYAEYDSPPSVPVGCPNSVPPIGISMPINIGGTP